MDREALIAYTYDIYSVEQAIFQTSNDITDLLNAKKVKSNEVNKEISILEDVEKKQANNLQIDVDAKEFYKKAKIKDMPYTRSFAAATILISIITVISLFFSLKMFSILIVCIAITIFITLNVYEKEDDKLLKKCIEKAEKKRNKITNAKIDSIHKETAESINRIRKKYEKEIQIIEKTIEEQTKQKIEFEQLKYDLYNSLLLIPYPHQNLYSACYIYRYLTTSKVTDLNYIFTQLNLEKIKNELSSIAKSQKELILIQRKILSEQKNQTKLLGNISNQISEFQNDFTSAINLIRTDIGEITENQRTIINNQAVMYNACLENAKNNAKTQEEEIEYMKMIENNSKVTAMFKRAEFLGLKMDRNYSGDY